MRSHWHVFPMHWRMKITSVSMRLKFDEGASSWKSNYKSWIFNTGRVVQTLYLYIWEHAIRDLSRECAGAESWFATDQAITGVKTACESHLDRQRRTNNSSLHCVRCSNKSARWKRQQKR